MYLYFLQNGKSMYSDTVIDITRLNSGDYEIDHIYPRCIRRDNSFDNLALVLRDENQKKRDTYPIAKEIQERQVGYWRYLLEHKFINSSKYDRLIRSTSLSAEELFDFINRQLVETSQSIKSSINLIRRLYPNVEVVYVKAENVSDFRQTQHFVKMRSLNDFHHAQDAYLNIVVGNVYHEKFTKNPIRFISEGLQTSRLPYSLNKMFEFPIKSGIVWEPKRDKATVKKMMNIIDIQITKRVEEKSGAFYHENLQPKNKKKIGIYAPVKLNNSVLSNISKYGGYDGITIAYFSIVKGTKLNGSIETHMVPIPVYLKERVNTDNALIKYVKNFLIKKKYCKIEIVYKKLYEKSLVRINGYYYYLGGRTDNSFYVTYAQPVVLKKQTSIILKRIEKHVERVNTDKSFEPNSKFLNDKFLKVAYKRLVNKMGHPLFIGLKGNKYTELAKEETYEKFKNLSINEKCKVILNILNCITLSRQPYQAKILGVSEFKPRFSFNLTSLDEFVIVNKSITGLFNNEVKII